MYRRNREVGVWVQNRVVWCRWLGQCLINPVAPSQLMHVVAYSVAMEDAYLQGLQVISHYAHSARHFVRFPTRASYKVYVVGQGEAMFIGNVPHQMGYSPHNFEPTISAGEWPQTYALDPRGHRDRLFSQLTHKIITRLQWRLSKNINLSLIRE